MSGNSAPKFPMLAHNFYIRPNCTSRKAFEFVSGNTSGPALRKNQTREILNDSRIKPFIDYSKQMVKYSIIRFIKERIDGVKEANYFSVGFDVPKLVNSARFSEHNQAIIDGAYTYHFVPVSESSVEEV